MAGSTGIQGWRVFVMVFLGLTVWFVVGAIVRLGLLAIDYIWGGIGSPSFGMVYREFPACYAGGYGAVMVFRKYINDRSVLLCNFILGIVLGSVLFGATLFFLLLDSMPLIEAAWYVTAGVSSVAGIWCAQYND